MGESEADAPGRPPDAGQRLEEIAARLEAMQRELDERPPVDQREDEDPPPAARGTRSSAGGT